MGRFDELVKTCDAAIRAGHPQQASVRLAELNSARVPREWCLPIANLCRRTGMYTFGLKLLSQIVHSETDTPSPAELAEFAVILLRSGAVTEAMDWLGKVDCKAAPEALLYRAFGHFGRWEFNEAIPYLEQYLQALDAEYPALVGKVNLAHAYVESRRYRMAHSLLDQIQALASKKKYQQMVSYCMTLRGQAYFYEGKASLAESELRAALDLLPQGQTNDQSLVSKWSLILNSLENNSLEPLVELRARALKNRDWLALREVDLYSQKVRHRIDKLLHLYFGTPFPGFRERIFHELNIPPERNTYILGPKESPRFDLTTGEIDGRSIVKPGKGTHKLIEALLRDFYQPQRLCGLFSALYPGEYFDIFTSPDRVHQVLRRTRAWLEDQSIPVRIAEADGFYSLSIEGAFSFRVPLERQDVNRDYLMIEKLKLAFQSNTFSSKEAQVRLQLSKTNVNLLLSSAVKSGQLIRLGTSKRNYVYQSAPPQSVHERAA